MSTIYEPTTSSEYNLDQEVDFDALSTHFDPVPADFNTLDNESEQLPKNRSLLKRIGNSTLLIFRDNANKEQDFQDWKTEEKKYNDWVKHKADREKKRDEFAGYALVDKELNRADREKRAEKARIRREDRRESWKQRKEALVATISEARATASDFGTAILQSARGIVGADTKKGRHL